MQVAWRLSVALLCALLGELAVAATPAKTTLASRDAPLAPALSEVDYALGLPQRSPSLGTAPINLLAASEKPAEEQGGIAAPEDYVTPIALAALQQPNPTLPFDEDFAEGVQDSPAAPEFYRQPTPEEMDVPDYLYEARYYNTPYEGARPLADYAPPSYEPLRDYQDAPGVPEFVRLTPPSPPTPEDAGRVVTRGIYPNSFLIPGIDTSFRLRGFVRLAALYDFAPAGLSDAFVPNTIPVPQTIGRNFNMSGRISRFAVESWTPTNFNEWNVHTFIEGDFFNGAPQAAGGGGNPFRLRHAFVDFGYFRFGQQNTVFMDGQNWPSLVDFQGPNGWINQRQPSLRMTLPIADQLYWASSVERPFSDVSTNSLGAAVQDVPDVATHLRLGGPLGHLQGATLLRTIGYRPTGGDVTRRMGVGLSGSAVIHPWAILLGTNPVTEENPSGLTRSRVLLQYTWGPGIARYVNDLVGQGLDAQVDPATGSFNLVDSTGWHASYEHWFNARWLANFTYSQAQADVADSQPATTYDAGTYLATSVWWIPVPRLSAGVEYLWGERENRDGQSAEAERLHALLQYNF